MTSKWQTALSAKTNGVWVTPIGSDQQSPLSAKTNGMWVMPIGSDQQVADRVISQNSPDVGDADWN